MQIVFTDPPPPRRRSGRSQHPWAAIAKQLQERPGEWALCLRGVYDSTAGTIRRGLNNAFPAGEFDAVGRIPDNLNHLDKDVQDKAQDANPGQRRKLPIFDLYIRYIAENERTTSDTADNDTER